MPIEWLDTVLGNNEARINWVVERSDTRPAYIVERLSTGSNIGEGLHTGSRGDCERLVGRTRLARADRSKSWDTWSWLTRPHRGKSGRLRTVSSFNLVHLEGLTILSILPQL